MFLKKILGRSIQVHVYRDKDLATIDVDDRTTCFPPHKVMIGFSTRSTMRKNDLLPTEEVHCAIACQTFLTEAYKYAVAHLPLSDAVLQNAEFLDIKTCANASFDNDLFFVDKFLTLKEKLEGHMDTLYDQFVEYQQVDASAKELSEFARVDQVWNYLGHLQENSGLKFNLLFEVVKYVLVLPHSNAEEERVFSTVAKNKTTFRSNLSNKTTTPSILTCKTNFFNKTPCYKFVPSPALLRNAKRAASTYNNSAHNSNNN